MLAILEVPGIKRIDAELRSTPASSGVGAGNRRELACFDPIHRPQCVRRERAIDLCVGRVGIGRGDLTTIDTRRL